MSGGGVGEVKTKNQLLIHDLCNAVIEEGIEG